MKKKFLICLTTLLLGLAACGSPKPTPTEEKFTVSFAANEATYGTVSQSTIKDVVKGTAMTVSGNSITIGSSVVTATPAASDAQYAYAFESWSGVAATVTENLSVTANFTRTVQKYTITWKNGDETIKTDTDVAYGTLVSTKAPADPSKPTSGGIVYTFEGWDVNNDGIVDSLEGVQLKANMVIAAVFSSEALTFDVVWMNGETEYKTDEDVAYDTLLTSLEPEQDPTKDPTATLEYEFAGWDLNDDGQADDLEDLKVIADMTLKACYSESTRYYTLTWKNGSEDYQVNDDCEYDSSVAAKKPATDPTKEADKDYIYTFEGWDVDDDEVVDDLTDLKVAADMTIKAVYSASANEYGYMRDIISQVDKGSVTFNDLTGVVTGVPSGTAGFAIRLSNAKVQSYGEGKTYLELDLTGSPTEFQIIIDNNGAWTWGYVYVTLTANNKFYIPLAGDTKYNPAECTSIILYACGAGQNVSINSLKFVNDIDYVRGVSNGTRDGNVFKNSGNNMTIYLNKDLINTYSGGKEFIKINVEGADAALFAIITMPEAGGEVWNYNNYNGAIYAGAPKTCYIPLNDKNVHDFSKNDLRLFSQYDTHGIKINSIEFVNSSDFTFVSGVTNGSYDPATKVATASANDMSVYLNHTEINYVKGDNEVLELNLTGPANFRIKTTDNAGKVNDGYVYETLYTKTYYIPLNDPSIHDFSQYDLILNSWESVHTLTINSVKFIKTSEINLVLGVTDGTLQDGVYVASKAGMYITLGKNAIQTAGNKKDFMCLELTGSPTELQIILNRGGTWTWGYVWTAIYSNSKFYIPMAGDTKYNPLTDDILLYSCNAGQNIKIDSITFCNAGDIDVIKSVQNGTRNGNTFTNAGNNMYIRFDNGLVKTAAQGKNYIKLTIKGADAALYALYTYPTTGGELNYNGYTGAIYDDPVVIYVPLNDGSVHNMDGANGICLYSAYDTHGICIVSIEYVNEIPA